MFQTGFQVYLGSWSRDHRRWRRAMTMPRDCAKWDKLFLSATIQMQSLSYLSRSDKHIFWQVCESARINFDSFRKAVKAACKCKTKECPAWDCWCDDEDEDEETGGSCRCPTCDCDVCNSCKVINNMLSQSFVWAQMFYHLTISLAVWVWSFPLTVSLDYTIASQMALL